MNGGLYIPITDRGFGACKGSHRVANEPFLASSLTGIAMQATQGAVIQRDLEKGTEHGGDTPTVTIT